MACHVKHSLIITLSLHAMSFMEKDHLICSKSNDFFFFSFHIIMLWLKKLFLWSRKKKCSFQLFKSFTDRFSYAKKKIINQFVIFFFLLCFFQFINYFSWKALHINFQERFWDFIYNPSMRVTRNSYVASMSSLWDDKILM